MRVALVPFLTAAAVSACEPWCTNPCSELNGNVENECGDCVGEEYACRAVAIDALGNEVEVEAEAAPLGVRQSEPMPAPRTVAANEQSLYRVPLSDASQLSAREHVPCQRVSAAELADLTTARLTEVLDRPTLISGLIDEWSALQKWKDAEAFAHEFGQHGVLAKRVMSYTDKHLKRSAQAPDATLVPVRDVLQSAHDRIHIVLYDGEPGNAEAEEEFISALLNSSRTPCPPLLRRACGTLVLSLGGGQSGVEMANHGLAWIGLVAGMKLWHVRESGTPRPANPRCERDSIDVLPNVTTCLQRPGEVMVVPTAWWHATCNLGEFTLGVGGQDSCDLIDCTPPGPADETEMELHMRKEFCRDSRRSVACNLPRAQEALESAQARRAMRDADGRRPWTLKHEEWLR